MVSRSGVFSRFVFFAAIALILPAASFAQTTGPQIVIIQGDPLTINVAADGSFQVFNSAVPGHGQIFPTGCQYGDMGIFADVNGTLFAPAFGTHTCGTATGGIGTNTPWTMRSISQVQGAGEGPSPYTVTVSLAGGGVSVVMTITYVNGDNFFRVRTSLSSAGSRTVRLFFGADIYLASSDAGIFFFEPDLHAPGGVDCAIPPTYHILLIPTNPTQATHIADNTFGNIWAQIAARRLNDNVTPTTCVDNGAALEWDNVLSSGVNNATIQSAVSFGSIPTNLAIAPFFVTVDPNAVSGVPGQSFVFNVTTAHNSETDFNSTIDLSLDNPPPGITATFSNPHIAAPGDGTSKMTLTLAPDVFPATYRGVTVLGTGGDGQVEGGSVTVDVICDPPVLLTLNNPQSQTVKKGQTVTLHVKPEVGSTFTYQWFAGHAGFTSTPIANSNSPNFTTPPINTTQEFWVRISDACGVIDSQTATIIPTN
jgi:Ig-like domain-containing protein